MAVGKGILPRTLPVADLKTELRKNGLETCQKDRAGSKPAQQARSDTSCVTWP